MKKIICALLVLLPGICFAWDPIGPMPSRDSDRDGIIDRYDKNDYFRDMPDSPRIMPLPKRGQPEYYQPGRSLLAPQRDPAPRHRGAGESLLGN